ncbi:MAG: ATP-binding protein, partial [Acidobacteria bacterium]|nr:ATP-binding protein [Acidobacteriota bacterium]
LHLLHGEVLPLGAAELEGLARLWEREAALAGSALYLELDHLEDGDPQREGAARRLVDILRAPLFVASRERRRDGLRP